MGIEILQIDVVGESFYKSEIASIGMENDEYNAPKRQITEDYEDGDRIWKYDFYPMLAQVVPEPDNPHDTNAIKVVVGGVQVGHIARVDQEKVKPYINRGDIEWTAYISGGPYKELEEDDDGNLQIRAEKHDFSVKIVAELMGKPENPAPEKTNKKTATPAQEIAAVNGQNINAAAEDVSRRSLSPEGIKVSNRNFTATLLFAIFLGGVGAHRFYAGKTGTAILWLLTGGFGAIGWIVDVVTILSGTFTDWDGAYILSESAQKKLREKGALPAQGVGCYILAWVFVGFSALALAFELYAGLTVGLPGLSLLLVIGLVIYFGVIAWILSGKADAAPA